ncbi:MAG: hypothetical protein QG641_1218 [Candidatus Poribacteria bacterium]|nr:hypothetical protein [Candidatus Poribacteria bacterium]
MEEEEKFIELQKMTLMTLFRIGRENVLPKIEKRVHLRGIIKGAITADKEREIDQAIDEVKKIWESRQI